MILNKEELDTLVKLIEFRIVNSIHLESTQLRDLSVLASKLKTEARGDEF